MTIFGQALLYQSFSEVRLLLEKHTVENEKKHLSMLLYISHVVLPN